MNTQKFYLIILMIFFFNQPVFSMTYSLPEKKSRIIGKNINIIIPEGNKLPLEHFCAHFKIGLSNMLEANPGVDVYLPNAGTNLIIPKQLILPDTPRKGIIINSAEMRLYYYPKDTNTVIVLPIGIGEFGRNTPFRWITSIKYKKFCPTWTPTKTMHEEYEKNYREKLPNIFPVGPDNPMGLYALYIGQLYAIHGTNANFGIGLRVSHGCIRLRSEDIKYLYDNVPVGIRVQFINEPVKISVEPSGICYIEVHKPLSITNKQFNSNDPVPIILTKKIKNILIKSNINNNAVKKALLNRYGIPTNITLQVK